ncbi:uncharacterized protein LOC134198608 [Corticium candelabrum]|uniref:uncharacterized protein LOC134198608 n=1 Tax=Corticium candelabrum TaxID=121492 RepID=UPI002E25DC53|nr:uncharacterized protein LOC134198608 [Corticium candelabrum]
MDDSVRKCKAYLSNLQLDLPPPTSIATNYPLKRVTAVDEVDGNCKNKPAVVGSMTVQPSSDLSAELYADVQNSCLLAQLAAKKKVPDSEKNPVKWYKAYREVLENIGWRITDFGFNKSETNSNSFTVKKSIIGFLETLAIGPELAGLKLVIDALTRAANGEALEVFKNTSKSQVHGKFQLGTAKPAGDGTVTIAAGAFYFPSSSSAGTVSFFFDWSLSDIELYQSNQTMDLNMDVYKYVREDIIEKLGPHAKNYVKDIEI